MMMMQLERSTRRLSPRVSVALSRIPSSNCQSESEAFSISSKSRIESFSFSVCHWLSASWVSRGWVSRCPRYPGGEPISLAISWECWNSAQSILMQARASPKRDSATASTTRVLPEPVGPRNSRLPTGRPWRIQPGQKHLIDFRDLLDRLVLPHNLAAQGGFKVAGVVAAAARIQHGCKVRSHRFGPLFPFRELHVFCETAHFCHLLVLRLHWEKGAISLPALSLCKPLAIHPKAPYFPVSHRFRCD